ncbi:MAG: phytoene/squalene synthase family protein [Mucilaginibacter sp.]|nr:phytoene/squalene synthase family protein [Mucilaginibacter sp.]
MFCGRIDLCTFEAKRMAKMDLYDEACFECSKLITTKYSTSFSKGIKAFNKQFRYPVYAIYGFVRYADEIVDTFHNHDKARLISDFKQETFKAINQKISLNPVLHSFQIVVNQYSIDHQLIEEFLRSMEMDLDHKVYDDANYQTYIHGSAGVIGLMCLQVFCEGNKELYQQLMPMALSLGAAFQKINFLRDIKSDYEDRGRTYFPGIDFKNFTQQDKQRIEADIQHDFDEGYKGIMLLPKGVRLGVYVAYCYYLQLFKKIAHTPVNEILDHRIRVSNIRKGLLYVKARIKQGI